MTVGEFVHDFVPKAYQDVHGVDPQIFDIAFEPQLSRWPQIGHAAIVELKYLKKDDDASPDALAKIRAAAREQIARYAADKDLARKWNLTTQGGTVTLHRIVLVFHGGDVALCEEIA